MNAKKPVYFGLFSSKKAFLSADLTSSVIQNLYDQVKRPGRGGLNWAQIKLILLHKNCPPNIIAHYAKSPTWYIRLVAMLNNNTWATYAEHAAVNDPKSTVRAAAINRLWTEGVWTEEVVVNRVKKDKRVQGYFSSLLN